jgi:hypothetical protein
MDTAEKGVNLLMQHFQKAIIQKEINKEGLKFKSRIPGLIRKHFLSKRHTSFDLSWLISVCNLSAKLDVMFCDPSPMKEEFKNKINPNLKTIFKFHTNINLGYKYVSSGQNIWDNNFFQMK